MSHSTTIAQAEQVCREFAAQYPAVNVLQAVELAEAGRLSWFQVEGLFTRALAEAVAS